MDQDKINILRIFQLDGTPVSCEDYGSGHVNVTFLVVTDTGRRYILQKINHHAFRNVQALSENIAAVTDFLRSKSSDPRSVMSLIRTKDGAPHTRYGDEYWRVYDYVDGTICLQQPETDEDFYQAAVGFGTFAQLLSDFPAEKLHETIPNFHNTPDRCRLSARRSSATLWAAPRPFSRRSILLLQGKRRCPRSRTFFLPERSRSALRTTTQSSTTSFWTRRHERRSAL